MDGRPVIPKLIGVNDLWEIVFTQESDQECLRGLGIAVTLEQNALHVAMLVHSPPCPVSDAIDAHTHLVQMPAGTPPGFPIAQIFREEGSEFDTTGLLGKVSARHADRMQRGPKGTRHG